MYSRIARAPLPEEQRISDFALHVAALAIESSRAKQALKASEERNRAILQALPDSMFLLNSDFTYLACEPRSSCRFPIPAAELLGKNMREVLPFELAEKFVCCCESASQSGEPKVVEYNISMNGETIYFEARIIPTNDGKFLAFVRDITERRRAEETLKKRERALRRGNARLREFAGRLMTAHEEERQRISRRLREVLNQKVAALSLIASSVKYRLRPDELNSQLDKLQMCAIEIAEGMRELSHELHPAVLEHIGLAAALKAYVADLSRLQNLQIALTVPDDVKAIPPDVALCLYRVAQECLHNIIKHSGVNSAEVTLWVDEQAVHLHVADSGLGFDVNIARRNGGLGLAGIEERLRFMRGSLTISTQVGGGSRLLASIPLRK
jgi:PAS domain S-box-containing protein